jgi:hypothetical protein
MSLLEAWRNRKIMTRLSVDLFARIFTDFCHKSVEAWMQISTIQQSWVHLLGVIPLAKSIRECFVARFFEVAEGEFARLLRPKQVSNSIVKYGQFAHDCKTGKIPLKKRLWLVFDSIWRCGFPCANPRPSI